MRKILIIDDDVTTCKLLSSFLNKHGYNTAMAFSGKEALKMLQETAFDLIFCDYVLTDIKGKEMFGKIKSIQPHCAVIFITGHASVQIAVDLMKTGAYYYLEKPLLPEKILDLINSAFNKNDNTGELLKTGITGTRDQFYVKGNSAAAEMLYTNVSLIAPTNYSVIIFGETGTGKERLARLIHDESNRAANNFIAVDCGSLSKELAVSELFGHEKGSFTGAVQAKTGAFEMADKGTIFLDEIGNLSYEVQAILLRALQEKHIRKVGSNKEQEVDVRIIVASNRNLYDLVEEQKFREDLFHRLNEFTIIVPPIRERLEDLDDFVASFIAMAEKELGKKIKPLSAAALELLQQYPWPGNVRELKNFIKRLTLLTPNNESISQELLLKELNQLKPTASAIALNTHKEQPGGSSPNLKEVSQKAELEKIMEVLKTVNYNKTKAAAILKINRKTLYNKLNPDKNPED